MPARAVIVEKLGHGTRKGVSIRLVRLDVVLRVVGDDEGQTTIVIAYVAPRAAVIATAGLEVPVRVDASSGALLGLDVAACTWPATPDRRAAGRPSAANCSVIPHRRSQRGSRPPWSSERGCS